MEKALIKSKTLYCCIDPCTRILFAIVFNVDISLNPVYWSLYVYTA